MTTLVYGGGEFTHNHIYTLQSGLLQLLDLLFHYSLKGQVRGEKPRPVEMSRQNKTARERKRKKTKETMEKEAPNEELTEEGGKWAGEEVT